jgi:4-azaleucine resistance transporter AzlC
MGNDSPLSSALRRKTFLSAFKYTFPVLLGYSTIGVAFGLLLAGAGYPWYLALMMSLWMYAGAAQFIAVGLFAAGTSLWEACLIQLVVNARHMAYGLSMLKHYQHSGVFKPYLVFSLTDETFALLSSLSENPEEDRRLFYFYVSILDQCYWVAGSVIGAVAGALIPFDLSGIGFALTALFVVLLIEQILKVRKPGIFILSAAAALAGVFLIPGNFALLASLALALLFAPLIEKRKKHEQS